MRPVDKYKSAANFRVAVKSKLNEISRNTEQDVQRLYRQTAYAQFLARLFFNDDISWVLKGGHALELRLQKARATKDIDLAMKDMKWLHSKKEHSSILRELLLEKSQIDIGIGDAWIEPQDTLRLSSHLEELGLESFTVKAIPIEQHIAEKIHSLTLPRDVSNSRVKDLVDLFLIFKFEKFSNKKTKDCIKETFIKRNTHKIPIKLIFPGDDWEKPFKNIMDSVDETVSMDEVFKFVNKYFISYLS